MSDLISREKLLQAIDEKYNPRVLTPSESVIVSWIYEMIQAFPSAEPKHGKWEKYYIDYESFGKRPSIFYCSECGSCSTVKTDYCPNCGKDMERT